MNFSRIRELNDIFRRTLQGGKVSISPGIETLGEEAVSIAVGDVQYFSDFPADADPLGEHNFGTFQSRGQSFVWQIEYFDLQMQSPSHQKIRAIPRRQPEYSRSSSLRNTPLLEWILG